MNSCLYQGLVEHNRFRDVAHRFRYRHMLVCLDLDELDRVFDRRWLWSHERFNVQSFRRRDHLGDPRVPLAEAVRDLVEQEHGFRPVGPIRLATQLRHFGYVLNPVSFHYAYDAAGERVVAIIADITNTPWGERRRYVLDARDQPAPIKRFRLVKDFHISPFLPLGLTFDWTFHEPGDNLSVAMTSLEHDQPVFQATLRMQRLPFDGPSAARVLARHAAMSFGTVAAIYWQALRLLVKHAPFHDHPDPKARRGPIPPKAV